MLIGQATLSVYTGCTSMINNITRDQLSIGMEVSINPRDDHTRRKIISGKIQEILTNKTMHPYGIMVRLQDNQVGRVKEILTEETIRSFSNKDASFAEFNDLSELIKQGENHFVEFKLVFYGANIKLRRTYKKRNHMSFGSMGKKLRNIVLQNHWLDF